MRPLAVRQDLKMGHHHAASGNLGAILNSFRYGSIDAARRYGRRLEPEGMTRQMYGDGYG